MIFESQVFMKFNQPYMSWLINHSVCSLFWFGVNHAIQVLFRKVNNSTFLACSAYASGGSNENTPGSFSRFRGPFTPSQWMELEHQALIYKHFVANIPVPHHLLIPIKKSVNPYAFSGLSAVPYASSNCKICHFPYQVLTSIMPK